MQYAVSPTKLKTSAAQAQARIDLAAAHRLAERHGFNEGIFNHLTYVVPGKQRPLLPDPVRPALVGGDGVLLHGGRHRRRQGQARRKAKSSAPATASMRRSTQRCRRPRRCFIRTCPMPAR